MVVVLISSLLFLYLIINAGLLFSKKLDVGNSCTDIVFIGIVSINTLVTILSILIPINFYLFVFLFFLSFLFHIKNKKIFYNFCIKSIEFESRIFYILIIIFALYYSSTSPEIFDTHFYHIQSIKWIEEYKLIPGLANIHGRFGFNSNVFTLYALTSFEPIFQQHILIVNYLTFIILLTYFLNKLFSTFQNEKITNKFLAYFISLIFLLFNLSNLSSASPDFLSFIVTYYILIRTFELSYSIDELNNNKFLPLVILCFYVLTIKLSTLPIIILPLFFFYKLTFTKKELIKLSILLILIISPWLIRNTIITGWLIYPFPQLDLFNFDWKVPKDLVVIENLTIVGWARLENHDLILDIAKMKFSNWFPIWFSHLSNFRIFILFFSFTSPIIYFLFFSKRRKNLILTALICTLFLGLCFWLFMAPDFRFAKAFIYVSFISPLFFLSFTIKLKQIIKYYKFILFFIFTAVCFKIFIDFNPIKNNKFSGIIIPLKTSKPVHLTFFNYTIGNHEFYYPSSGVQCYDQKIPCVPYLNRNFTLRGEKIEDGFKYIKN